MDFLGIGPFELLFILLIMLVVLGPRDMVKTGRSLGRMIRTVIKSPLWASMMNTSRELREIPTRLVRESGIEDEVTELRHQMKFGDVSGGILNELKQVDEEVNQSVIPTPPPVEHAEQAPVKDTEPLPAAPPEDQPEE